MNTIIRRIIKISALAVLIASMIPVTVMAAKRCDYTGCNNKPVDGGRYCSSHTCIAPGCKELRYGGGTSYCYQHKCNHKGCSSRRVDGSNFCSTHRAAGEADEAKAWEKVKSKTSTKKSSSGSSKKKYDYYNVYDYKSAQDFADDKYEEFYDYEDDYDDKDEAYDAAEDYWREHHGK